MRLYEVTFENVAVSAAQDLLEINPASNKPCLLWGFKISQNNRKQDAQEEMLRIAVIRGHTTSGSGGTAPTPNPRGATGQAAGFAAEVNNTTIASVGTTQTKYPEAWNIRSGLVYAPTFDEMIECINGALLVVRLLAAPSAAMNMAGEFVIAEFG